MKITQEELDWRATVPTNRGEMFDDAIIAVILDNKRQELHELSLEFEEKKKCSIKYYDDDYECYKEFVLKPIQQEMKKLNILIDRLSGKYKNNNGADIATLKNIPILTILDSYNIKCENAYGNLVKFKIRNEKTASAVLYVDQNAWWDYGAQAGGSPIDLIMALDGCDTKDAINKLKTYL